MERKFWVFVTSPYKIIIFEWKFCARWREGVLKFSFLALRHLWTAPKMPVYFISKLSIHNNIHWLNLKLHNLKLYPTMLYFWPSSNPQDKMMSIVISKRLLSQSTMPEARKKFKYVKKIFFINFIQACNFKFHMT